MRSEAPDDQQAFMPTWYLHPLVQGGKNSEAGFRISGPIRFRYFPYNCGLGLIGLLQNLTRVLRRGFQATFRLWGFSFEGGDEWVAEIMLDTAWLEKRTHYCEQDPAADGSCRGLPIWKEFLAVYPTIILLYVL